MNKTKSKYKQKAFTLIELMVIIVIIGFLASIVLLALGKSREKSRDARRQVDARNIGKALELYFSENNTYPQYGAADSTQNFTTAMTGAVPSLAPNYMASIPKDPLTPAANTQPYQYTWGSNGGSWGLNVYYESSGAYCKYRSGQGLATWFSSSPDCTK